MPADVLLEGAREHSQDVHQVITRVIGHPVKAGDGWARSGPDLLHDDRECGTPGLTAWPAR
jgi:hypothetical protein